MELDRIALLIGRQRSGTHMLGAMIGSHPRVKYTGEIFWSHKRARDWGDMMTKIERVAGGGFDVILVDVKYNQISAPVETLVAHPEVKVIQIIRRDIRRLYYSGELHTFYGNNPWAKEDRVAMTFRVDPARLEALRRSQAEQVAKWKRFVDMQLFYEDLTGNREVEIMPEKYSQAVCMCLGIEVKELTTGTKKVAQSDIEGLLIERGRT